MAGSVKHMERSRRSGNSNKEYFGTFVRNASVKSAAKESKNPKVFSGMSGVKQLIMRAMNKGKKGV